MFKDVTFGQYYPINSPVHRLDARVKLLLTILFVVSIFFIKSYFGFMLTAAVLIIVILVARLPIMSVLKMSVIHKSDPTRRKGRAYPE